MSVGLHIMRPTTVVVAGAGSSASIRADGGVDFATATSLSLNGVFSSAYDNYMIVFRGVAASGNQAMLGRMRLAGSDNATSTYTLQQLSAQATTVSAVRLTTQTSVAIARVSATQRTGTTTYIYGPALAQPTAWRNVTADGRDSGAIIDAACTHSVSTAFDGFTMTTTASTATGTVTVYGYAQ